MTNEKKAKIEEVLELVNFAHVVKNIIQQQEEVVEFKKMVSPLKEKIKGIFDKTTEQLKDMAIEAYDLFLSEGEVDIVLNFLKTDVGRKINSKAFLSLIDAKTQCIMTNMVSQVLSEMA